MPRWRGEFDRALVRVVASRITTARIRRGYLQKEVAEAVGVSVRQVCLWEKGKSSPSLPILRELCLFLRVTPNALLGVGEPSEDDVKIFSEEYQSHPID